MGQIPEQRKSPVKFLNRPPGPDQVRTEGHKVKKPTVRCGRLTGDTGCGPGLVQLEALVTEAGAAVPGAREGVAAGGTGDCRSNSLSGAWNSSACFCDKGF